MNSVAKGALIGFGIVGAVIFAMIVLMAGLFIWAISNGPVSI